MKTPFYELAEKIGNDMYTEYFMCDSLIPYGSKYRNFLEDYFKPNIQECREYNHCPYVWASENDKPYYRANNFRILALLFADLLWQEEMKGEKK